MEGKILPIKRVCVACDATETRHWRLYDGSRFCDRCYQNYIRDRKVRDRRRSPRRINYKGKIIRLRVKPRTGVCSLCYKVGRTSLHHFAEYHDNDPLKDTIELCLSCHMKESWKLGQMTKRN